MPGHFFRQMKNPVPRQTHKYGAARHGHAHGKQKASVHGKADGPGTCFFWRNNDKKAGENHQRTQHGADCRGRGIGQIGPHGAGAAQPGPGRIELRVVRDGKSLRASVADDGMGLQPGTGAGMGLANVRAQLEARYGARAMLRLSGRDGSGTLAEIVIPMEPLA